MLWSAAGTLPATWADNQGFSALSYLAIWEQKLTGNLPAEWGKNGSFPALEKLYLGAPSLTGTLPSAWGSNTSFQNLSLLNIGLCSNITGILLCSTCLLLLHNKMYLSICPVDYHNTLHTSFPRFGRPQKSPSPISISCTSVNLASLV